MAIITKIVLQQKNKARFNIYVDSGNGEEYAFSVHEDVLVSWRLQKGMKITVEAIKQIVADDEEKKAYHHVLHFLSYRMRSEKEVRAYMHKKEYDERIIEKIIVKLRQQRYLNDVAFANAFIQSRINTTEKGPAVIEQELKQKGINAAIIDDSLKQFNYEKQLEKALKLIEKKSKGLKGYSSRQRKQKIGQYLLAKGYSHDLVQAVLEEDAFATNDDEEMKALCLQAEKGKRKFHHLSSFEYEQKMKQWLLRRGFSFPLIEKYLQETKGD